MKKHIFVLFIVSLILMTIPVLAYDPNNVKTAVTTANVTNFTNTGKNIVKIFQVIGTFVAVAVLAYVGIRFMLASPSEKAQLKGALIPYIVGAIIMFAAVNIATILSNLGGKI